MTTFRLWLLFAIGVVGSVHSWIVPITATSLSRNHWKLLRWRIGDISHGRCGSRLHVSQSIDETSTKSRSKSTTKRNKKSETEESDKEVSKKKKKTPKEPSFWLADGDNVLVGRDDENEGIILFHCKIRGNPKVLVRHRTSKGHMYNPSAVHQENFRNLLKTIASSQNISEFPLFAEDDCLALDIILRMKRPTNHFVSGKRGPGRIKPTAPRGFGQYRSDIDNNVKFVMDSMNEVVYPDDRQISRLYVTRVLDNEGLCEGSTEIRLRTIRDDDSDVWVDHTFQDVNLSS